MAHLRSMPSGRWQAVIRKRGFKPASKTFRSKLDAQRWARDVETEMERGAFVNVQAAQRVTIRSLIDRYKEEISTRKAGQDREISKLKKLDSCFGHLVMSQLTPELVLSYVDDQRSQGMAAATIKRELSVLSHLIKVARSLWQVHIPENPVKTALEIIQATRTLPSSNKRSRRLTRYEENRLLNECSPEVKPVIAFTLETGMRRGELVNARREHVRGNTLLIPVNKTQRPRTIPLSQKALEIVHSLPIRLDGSLFGLKADSITQAFNRACQRAGIEDLRFHDLRHEATSRLFEMGLDIQEVASITGHSDWRTLKRYTHVKPDELAAKLA